jgi:phage shock protein E
MNYMNTTMLLILMLNFIGCGQESSTTAKAPTIQHLDSKQFQSKMTEKNTVVLDVRTKDEVSEGYIKGATLFIDVNGGDFDAQIKKLDKTKTYLVYCRSGKRSMMASTVLVENGFSKVYNLDGGISGYSGAVVK